MWVMYNISIEIRKNAAEKDLIFLKYIHLMSMSNLNWD